MDPIFDFSAAPHLPYSLREAQEKATRPEIAITAFFNDGADRSIVVVARNGEIYVDFGDGTPAPSAAGNQVDPLVFG